MTFLTGKALCVYVCRRGWACVCPLSACYWDVVSAETGETALRLWALCMSCAEARHLSIPQSRSSLGLPESKAMICWGRGQISGDLPPCGLFSLQMNSQKRGPGKHIVTEMGAQQPRVLLPYKLREGQKGLCMGIGSHPCPGKAGLASLLICAVFFTPEGDSPRISSPLLSPTQSLQGRECEECVGVDYAPQGPHTWWGREEEERLIFLSSDHWREALCSQLCPCMLAWAPWKRRC